MKAEENLQQGGGGDKKKKKKRDKKRDRSERRRKKRHSESSYYSSSGSSSEESPFRYAPARGSTESRTKACAREKPGQLFKKALESMAKALEPVGHRAGGERLSVEKLYAPRVRAYMDHFAAKKQRTPYSVQTEVEVATIAQALDQFLEGRPEAMCDTLVQRLVAIEGRRGPRSMPWEMSKNLEVVDVTGGDLVQDADRRAAAETYRAEKKLAWMLRPSYS